MRYFILFIITSILYSQNYYKVSLLDKSENYFFSKDKIYRHYLRAIPMDVRDFPVNQSYINILSKYGDIYYVSRWFNSVVMKINENNFEEVRKLNFVRSVEKICSRDLVPTEYFNYGNSLVSMKNINLDSLHIKGYTGKGIKIGVFDAGFPSVDTMPAYDSIRARLGFIYTYDFYSNNTNVYDDDIHGTYVLSIIGANLPGVYIGVAPNAEFFLARTEVGFFEKHLEEWNWLRAAETADSLGIDVINSSLGYSTFDPGEGDYTYKDMDGNTTIITKAADIAASKGIVVVTSAGNEGANAWGKITAPCDGDSVLCVGAVAQDSSAAAFSSRGPTSDGRIKPDVVALGSSAPVLTPNGAALSGGTSFSSPLVAGLVACLLQAVPYAQPMQVINAIKMSAHKADNPDTIMGYGIPNAMKALNILKQTADLNPSILKNKPYIKANISNDNLVFTVFAPMIKDYKISILNISGQVLYAEVVDKKTNFQYSVPINDFSQGLYLLKVDFKDKSSIFYKFVYY